MTKFALQRIQTWGVESLLDHVRAVPAGRYGASVVSVAAASAVTFLFAPIIGGEFPWLFFIPAILFATWIGGLGGGLFATALTVIIALLLGPGPSGWGPGEIVKGLAFVLIGCGIAWWGGQRNAALGEAAKVTGALIATSEDLLVREAHLRSILETVPDAMVVIDERGIMQSFSTAAQRLFGYHADEVVGMNVKMLMPSPYREGHDGYLDRYLRTGERRIIGIGRIVVGERKDGSTFPMELSIGEMKSNNNRFFTGFVRDLSERQKTEARLQELQSELVHISRLTAMGEMASALAHELNQPLSAIANYMKGSRRLLEERTDDDSRMIRDAMDKAAEQSLRAGEIIRRLRDFVARGETERHVESIRKLIEEASALALVGAKEQGVRVRFSFAPEQDLVLADKVQIQQVILNLMRNAMEAMEGSSRRELTISTTPVDGGMIRIDVADTGHGVAPEVAGQLFQPFVTTKPHGMGVGLSISRTIVEAHGGQITVEPNPLGGTIFGLTLRAVGKEDFGNVG